MTSLHRLAELARAAGYDDPDCVACDDGLECAHLVERERAVMQLARQVPALIARLEKLERVAEAARAWRLNMVQVAPGSYVDADDGSCAPGMRRVPSRNSLIAAVDALEAEGP